MGYSTNDSMVRVDFFKESGKWYATEAVKWLHYEGEGSKLIHDIFRESLKAHFTHYTMKGKSMPYIGMWAICLKPWHIHSHPIMMRWVGDENVE